MHAYQCKRICLDAQKLANLQHQHTMSYATGHSLTATISKTPCKGAFKLCLKSASGRQRQQRLQQRVNVARNQTSAVVCTSATGVTSIEAPESVWQTFSQNIAGEWEGVTASFGADGSPQELPFNAVPKDFSDWDLTLYDWQTQSSMLPKSSGVKCLFKRILPTVGCEADAQTFLEESSTLFEGAADKQHPVLSNGSYSTTSSTALTDGSALRCEHNLVLSKDKRVRLVQHLKSADATSPWQLVAVEVHNERYDQPYNAGAQLSGCGGGMNNIAEQDRLDLAVLPHDWKVQSGSSFDMSRSGSLEANEASQR